MKWYDPLKATGPFGWVSWLISAFNKNDKTFSKIGEGFGSIFNKYTGAGPTGADVYANTFSAEEAQKARDWEEEMSNTAFQRQVADMQKAGLNPALMYGGAGSAGASTPSSPSPSSVAPQSQGIGDIIGAVMDIALLKAQIQNINADTSNKLSEAAGRDIENKYKPALLEQDLKRGEVEIENIKAGINETLANISNLSSSARLNDARVREVMSSANKMDIEAATERLKQANIEADTARIAAEIENLYADRVLKVLEQSVLQSQTALNYANAKYVGLGSLEREFEANFRSEFGTNPNQPVWSAMTGLLGRASENLTNGISNLYDAIKGKLKK